MQLACVLLLHCSFDFCAYLSKPFEKKDIIIRLSMMFRRGLQLLGRIHVPARHFRAKGVKVAGIHEPAYLEELRPKFGFYDKLNLTLKGYDFVVLEKYQSYLNKAMTRKFDIKSTSAWSAPHQDLHHENLVDRSTAIDTTFMLRMYERNIQMEKALTTQLPILIEFIHATLPPGVTFSIDRHTKFDEDRLYFRDSVLEKLKEDQKSIRCRSAAR